MNFLQSFSIALFITIGIVASAVHSFNPLDSLRGITKHKARNVLSEVMGDVRRMEISKNPLSSLLLRGEPMLSASLDGKRKLMHKFNWTSCASGNQLMDIKSLSIEPSPLSFPGSLTFGFDIVFHQSILTNDKVKVALELNLTTHDRTIKFPCLGIIGSCTYDDLCSMLKTVSCPSLKTKGIPCNCPFKKGVYQMKDYSVTILSEVFPSGDWSAKAQLSSTNLGKIGCYEIRFTVV